MKPDIQIYDWDQELRGIILFHFMYLKINMDIGMWEMSSINLDNEFNDLGMDLHKYMTKHNIPKNIFIDMISKPNFISSIKDCSAERSYIWYNDLNSTFIVYLRRYLQYFGLYDKTIICQDCGEEFIFSIKEQKFFEEKSFPDPKRCLSCRKFRKAQKKYKGLIPFIFFNI